MERIYAGIVTYNPEPDRLIENLNAICHQVDKVIVVDNGSTNIDYVRIIVNEKNVTLIEHGENKGIACALNKVMSVAQESDVPWVLLLDQDSVCPDDMIQKYRSYIYMENVAVICPKIEDIYNPIEDKDESQYCEIVEFITSGSLNNVKVWHNLGKFMEELFIDMVDYDYAYRIQENGYKSIRINCVRLSHAIGHTQEYKIGFVIVKTYNHSAFRKYYITRNSLYLANRYPKYCNPFVTRMKILKRLLLVILFENDKKQKVCMMIKGYRDSNKFCSLQGDSKKYDRFDR